MTTRRSGGRGDPVVAVVAIVLTGVAAAYFAPLGDWVADNPLPGQEWMKQHTGLALFAYAVISALTVMLAWPRRSPFRSGQKVPDDRWDPATDGYLADLRRTMRTSWIEGFLAKSLERIVPAQLGFKERRDAISGPLRLVVPDGSSMELDRGTDIVEIFHLPRTERRLLVLGEPGAGKTTQLLRLTEHLLDDDAGPIPIVLTLSTGSWKVDPYKPNESSEADERLTARQLTRKRRKAEDKKKARIDLAVSAAIEWLAREISYQYQVPSAKVEQWLWADTSPIVLLLDGLDEVRDVEDRRHCVEVLSLLRARLNTGIVVCSRSAEYLEAGRLLEFGMAAEISALSYANIDEYLADAGPQLASLRMACKRNAELATLLNSPLALTVAVLTYQGKQLDEQTVAGLLSNRLDHLWSAYLREALTRQRSLIESGDRKTRFSAADSARYLCGLARLMERGGRDNFAVDGLNLSWVGKAFDLSWVRLPHRTIPLAYSTLILCAGVILMIFAAGATGVVFGLLCLAVFSVTVVCQVISTTDTVFVAEDISPVTTSTVEWNEFVSSRWRLAWAYAGDSILWCSTIGLLCGSFIGILGGPDGLLLGLLPGVVAGATISVMRLPVDAGTRRTVPGSKAQWWTLLVRITAGLCSLSVAVTLSFVLINLVSSEVRLETGYLMLSASAGLWLSGFAVSMYGWWSHKSAVATVIRYGILPRNIDEFLSHAEERIIMRRVLAGHFFLHRTLQTHLAGLEPKFLLDDAHPPAMLIS